VVGVVVLVPPHGLKSGGTPGQGKLMQMAVEPQRQGEGIGRMLVVQLEAYAFGQRKYTELFCHARLDAVGFYEKLGWVIQGEQFDEAGIGHYRMVQRAADANEVPNTRPE
jgi:ribosomal protein S18 acetylase RimI-like enzyme